MHYQLQSLGEGGAGRVKVGTEAGPADSANPDNALRGFKTLTSVDRTS